MSHGRVVVVLAAVGLAAGLALGSLGRAPLPVPSSPLPDVGTANLIKVHVGGWVVEPGVVSVSEGSIVADAIIAAGGMRPGAGTEQVNLAAPVMAGQQVIVPGPDQASFGPNGTGSGEGGRVAVNRATISDLEGLPGVGPVLAGRIVAYRDQNGPFATVEDLLQVPGIGEAKLAAIRDLIVIP